VNKIVNNIYEYYYEYHYDIYEYTNNNYVYNLYYDNTTI